MEEMELEIGGRPNAKRRLLHPVGRRGVVQLRQGLEFEREAFFVSGNDHNGSRFHQLQERETLLMIE